jgi:hypothetical protein
MTSDASGRRSGGMMNGEALGFCNVNDYIQYKFNCRYSIPLNDHTSLLPPCMAGGLELDVTA